MRGFLFNDVFMSMKYLITESKLNGAMIKFFEKEINLDEIQQHHPISSMSLPFMAGYTSWRYT